MVPENTLILFNAIVAGIMGGLILRFAQIASKKLFKKENFWAELGLVFLLIIFIGFYLVFIYS